MPRRRANDSEVEERSFDDEYSESDAEFTDSDASHSDQDAGSSGASGKGSASESEAEFTDEDKDTDTDKDTLKKSKKRPARKAPAKSTKNAKKEKKPRSRFLDVEAEVGGAEEDEDEDEETARELADFVADDEGDAYPDEAAEAAALRTQIATEERARAQRRAQTHASEAFDAEAEEQRLKALYGRAREASKQRSDAAEEAVRSVTSDGSLPRRPFLLPNVSDPKLWLCKCQQGKERSAALSLIRVVLERQHSPTPLSVFSVVCRDGLKGYVYIEAHKPTHVAQAIEAAKLSHCLYAGAAGKSLVLVPVAEMPQVLATAQKAAGTLPGASGSGSGVPAEGTWVRVRRGRYAGDLAMVFDVQEDENGGGDGSDPFANIMVRVKLIPRLALTSAAKASKERVPPRPFDPQEASRYGSVNKSRGFWVFGGESYRDGLLFKSFRLSGLDAAGTTATGEELQRWTELDPTGTDSAVMKTQSAGSAEGMGLGLGLGADSQPSFDIDEEVLVLEGEMKNLEGRILSIDAVPNSTTGAIESWAQISVSDPGGPDAPPVAVRTSHLRKLFRPGDSVRIVAGPHAGLSGIIVNESADKPERSGGRRSASSQVSLTVFDSVTNQQLSIPSVFCVRASALAAPGAASSSSAKALTQTNRVASFNLDDLVEWADGDEGVGVVVRIEDGDRAVAVFDALGQVRTVPSKTVRLLHPADTGRRSAAMDSYLSSDEAKQGDRLILAEATGLAGSGTACKVVQIYKAQAFVRILPPAPIAGSMLVCPKTGLKKPSSVLAANTYSMASNAAGPRGLMGKSVTITAGPHKGYVGFVKQLIDATARIELHTNGKIVTVAVDKLVIPEREKQRLQQVRRGQDDRAQFEAGYAAASAATPAWNSASAAGARTPAWNMAGASGGGRTPAWNSSGAKTPAWNSSSARTPAWNAQAGSGKTPAWNPGKTPAWNPASSATPAWGSASTPAWNVPMAVGQSTTAATWAKTPTWQQPTPSEDASTASVPDDWDQFSTSRQ